MKHAIELASNSTMNKSSRKQNLYPKDDLQLFLPYNRTHENRGQNLYNIYKTIVPLRNK